jgi:hypothetical protein
VRLDGSVVLEELDHARTLHDARLVLAMLAERGRVKATPKGNLPRAFVAEFRAQMREAPAETGERPEWEARWEAEHPPRNEEDLRRLHLARVLLELSGLIKRRQGAYSPTRRGEQLAAGERAGQLLATLVRTRFRRLNLAYLDGADDAPGLQQTMGYTLYQFGRVGGEWRTPCDLAGDLVLSAVRADVPHRPYTARTSTKSPSSWRRACCGPWRGSGWQGRGSCRASLAKC